MSTDRESKVEELLQAALDRPGPDRAEWVRDASGNDVELAETVLGLLHADELESEDPLFEVPELIRELAEAFCAEFFDGVEPEPMTGKVGD
jgi:hypothetical protein